jgi:radical SAM-linked protein
MIRLRITFAKTPAMRYTGHLDLHRAWERTFRRAGLPLAYSQGFNPHPRLNLASALPLGFTGEAEVIDAWLDEDLPLSQVQSALQPALPPGLQLVQIESVDLHLPALQTVLEASEYRLVFLEPFPALEERISALLSATNLPRRWRERDYDLRPLVLDIHLLPTDSAGLPQLSLRLSAREAATGRPEEVISVLGRDPNLARVHRTCLLFRSPA